MGPTCVQFDAEGWEYIVVFDYHEAHIISNRDDKMSYCTIEVNAHGLAGELVSDIRASIDDWADWQPWNDAPTKYNKIKLLERCSALESACKVKGR